MHGGMGQQQEWGNQAAVMVGLVRSGGGSSSDGGQAGVGKCVGEQDDVCPLPMFGDKSK